MWSRLADRVFSVLAVVAIALLLYPALSRPKGERLSPLPQPSGTPAKAKIDLTTDPSPAQKGSNIVRVKLTDPAGKPITGAQVTVTFFMEAMPAMNMPEMKTVVQGADKGGGMYEGNANLGSGGMWQVTVTAQQAGRTIVTNRVAVKATGGA